MEIMVPLYFSVSMVGSLYGVNENSVSGFHPPVFMHFFDLQLKQIYKTLKSGKELKD